MVWPVWVAVLRSGHQRKHRIRRFVKSDVVARVGSRSVMFSARRELTNRSAWLPRFEADLLRTADSFWTESCCRFAESGFRFVL
jgi:hypothetical protein